MSDELKPCPFCGGKAFWDGHIDEYGQAWDVVSCARCHIHAEGCSNAVGDDRAEARWNRRHAGEPSEAEVTEAQLSAAAVAFNSASGSFYDALRAALVAGRGA